MLCSKLVVNINKTKWYTPYEMCDMCKYYLHSPSNVESTNMGARVRKKSGQPKISNLGIKMFVQQNIWHFDISMYNAGLSIFMKIVEATSNSQTYVFSHWPIHIVSSFVLYFGRKKTSRIISPNLKLQN
jgi:hypothetical protein